MALAAEATGVPALDRLVEQLGKLPGIGPKSAERLMHYLLNTDSQDVIALAETLRAVKERVHFCRQCSHVTESELCSICADPRRDQGVICVVEESRHLMALERAANFRGVYHVLKGRLAPLENMGPEKLTVDQLLRRIEGGAVREVIMATNPTMEGDGTALYLSNLLAGKAVKITRLARGLSSGLSLEFANRDMLTDALEGRRDF
jgi:recombination protein RecR